MSSQHWDSSCRAWMVELLSCQLSLYLCGAERPIHCKEFPAFEERSQGKCPRQKFFHISRIWPSVGNQGDILCDAVDWRFPGKLKGKDLQVTSLLISTIFLFSTVKSFHFKENYYTMHVVYGLFFSILPENSSGLVKLYSLEVIFLTFCPINCSFLIFCFAFELSSRLYKSWWNQFL